MLEKPVGNTVCIVGLGYIGLPTAAVLALAGVRVTGVDIRESVVSEINAGRVHISEPGLDEAVYSAVSAGLLSASMLPVISDTFILAVPTPINQNKSVDLSHVFDATRSIAPYLRPGNLIILESTSPPGTTRKVADLVKTLRSDLIDESDRMLVHFAHAPERVLPGNTMVEIAQNDRVVGGLTPTATNAAERLYRTFAKGEILLTDATTAELVKLAENSFRDVNIAFANEISLIANDLDINPWEVIRLANRHPRVDIMQPGPGVGGHCIAVDPWFIVDAAPETARLIRAAREVNDSKPHRVFLDVAHHIREVADNATIAVLGLTFKKGIGDMRGSPALDIVERLTESFPRNQFRVSEPNIENLPGSLEECTNVTLVSTAEDAISDAAVVVLLVDHAEFAGLEVGHLRDKRVIDTRGLWQGKISQTEKAVTR